jgi:Domain of unknown function (DUF1707).
MSAQYNQNWTRGFGPWFTGPASDQHMRVSDAERQAVADRSAEHFSSGRLDQAEFDERVGRAMSAKTRADLNGLFERSAGNRGSGSDGPDRPGTGQPRRRHRHPILLAALIVFVAIAATHVVWPLLWIGFLVAIVLFATGTIGHGRSGQRR